MITHDEFIMLVIGIAIGLSISGIILSVGALWIGSE